MDRERKKRLALWKAMSEGLRIIEEDELEAEKNRPAARTRAYQNALGEQAQTPLGGVFIEIALKCWQADVPKRIQRLAKAHRERRRHFRSVLLAQGRQESCQPL